MGVDFIRQQAGKPYNKRWSNGVDRLKQPTLFEVEFSPECRFVTATLETDCAPVPGAEIVVQSEPAGACGVFSGHSRIATIAKAPGPVLDMLAQSHGIALATIDRIGSFGTTAELRFR